MPVFHDRSHPDGHPFKGGLMIFGAKHPASTAKPSTPKASPPTKHDIIYQPQEEGVNTVERDEEPAPYRICNRLNMNRPEEE